MSRSLGVCRVYRRIREERKRDAKGDPDAMPDIVQLKTREWFISPEEWPVIKRVADQLFPEGTTNWDEFWYQDDWDEWYDAWRELLEKEGHPSATSSPATDVTDVGGFDEELPQYEDSVDGQRLWLIRACKYLETRPDYKSPMPFFLTKGMDIANPPTPAEVHPPLLLDVLQRG